jgi:hypothetical protein
MRRVTTVPAERPEAPPRSAWAGPPLRTATSPAYWYCLAGILLLMLTFLVPLMTARRTARAEERGDRLAELLLREATALQPLRFEDPWQAAHLYARLIAAASAHDVYAADLEPVAVAAPALAFRNKHYVLLLRRAPPPDGAQEGGATPPLEVMAWPRYAAGPAHAAFFFAEDAEPAFSRNLQGGYTGEDPADWPPPGIAHRRPRTPDSDWSYRGGDDERWLLADRPAPGGARRPL